ncbi:nucleotidyltransferase domain-containing protein [Marinobacter bryozoorum]|uniref:nucleotidyltransferase family protein n=1 Tax=Marinobacter bryozoorum TaxID=256324 RepID=UPI002005AE8B|nr:nucleotidyltransferase domain-containing protein [Marinobacter bryozoorum]MCK7546242.1 nucleotidyltransferase domain-containing protein [Marinobacter bryozoorum]
MSQRKRYNLTDLVVRCDSAAPIPDELKEWDQAPSVGLEQTIMDDRVDISDVILQFRERLADNYDVIQLLLFGSRARGHYHSESDVDIAVILPGEPDDFVETKLELAGRAFDVLVQTGVRIQPFPIWETEWQEPAKHSNPELLATAAREGLIIWSRNK